MLAAVRQSRPASADFLLIWINMSLKMDGKLLA